MIARATKRAIIEREDHIDTAGDDPLADEIWPRGDWGDDPFVDVDRPSRRRRRPRRGKVALTATRAGRILVGAVALLFVATVVGLIALWPDGGEPAAVAPGTSSSTGESQAFGGTSLPASVDSSSIVRCPGPVAQDCRQIRATLNGGPDQGTSTTITLGPVLSSPEVDAGDHIRVIHVEAPPGADPAKVQPYQFADFDRHGSLIWLAVVFAVLVIALARWRGLLALVGLGLSLLLVVKFLIPAILAGSSPFLVSLVSALTVMFVMLALTSGIGAQSLAAALGIAGSLLLASLLGVAYVHIAHLNGYTSELSTLLTSFNVHVSLEGIVIAGMVIGALGVLADMAVTQASAVMALRRTNPSLRSRQLYREAFVVGRDHLAATINTLVLAYVGASLPLLLVIHATGVSTGDAFNAQDVAEPIVATLVGSIGLIASVPLTTGLAAVLASRVPPEAVPDHAGHTH